MHNKEQVMAVFTWRYGYVEVDEGMTSSVYEEQLGTAFLDDFIRKSHLAYLTWKEFVDAIWAVGDPDRTGGLAAYTRAEKLCHDMLWPLVQAIAITVEPRAFEVKRIVRS
jgi:hypothetical protein